MPLLSWGLLAPQQRLGVLSFCLGCLAWGVSWTYSCASKSSDDLKCLLVVCCSSFSTTLFSNKGYTENSKTCLFLLPYSSKSLFVRTLFEIETMQRIIPPFTNRMLQGREASAFSHLLLCPTCLCLGTVRLCRQEGRELPDCTNASLCSWCVSSGNWQLLKTNWAKLLAGVYPCAAGGSRDPECTQRGRPVCLSVCCMLMSIQQLPWHWQACLSWSPGRA